jgi:hypothetical protein
MRPQARPFSIEIKSRKRNTPPVIAASHLQQALEMMSVGWCEVRSLEDTLREIRGLPLSN